MTANNGIHIDQGISFDAFEDPDKRVKHTYYFELDADNKPIKLGDGSFGAVFAVRDANNRALAVKIFYDIEQIKSENATKQNSITQQQNIQSDLTDVASSRGTNPNLVALRRFKDEMYATSKIRGKLPPGAGELSNLVLSIAATENFCESPAGQKLKTYFESISLSISNYALVMDRYYCTLKHLLEKKRPEQLDSDDEVLKRKSELRGYDVLRHLGHLDREKFIAWVTREVMAGLKILHRAELRHHDIKPANILIRSDAAGRLQVALGDLGFLTANPAVSPGSGTVVPNLQSELPLGTRHYRSVEQRDYFDVCEVDVVPNAEYQLITDDPKFRDSLMEKRDILQFSKDKKSTRYDIEHIRFNKETGCTEIKLSSDNKERLKADTKTQVFIYKQHTVRTDLFGIGALIYDMLTCGKSPERFYDFIRTWDRPKPTKREEGATAILGIDDIISEYRQRYHTQTPGAMAEISSVFDELRFNHDDWPSPSIVSIILRCMLSRANGSYLFGKSLSSPQDISSIYDALEKDLEQLGSGEQLRTAKNNSVWRGQKPEKDKPTEGGGKVSEPLRRLQQIWQPAQRLADAYVFLDPIVKLLFTAAEYDEAPSVSGTPDRSFASAPGTSPHPFYADMSPTNIELVKAGREYNALPRDPGVFKTKRDFEKALEDNLLALVTGTLRKPFSPLFMSAMVRSVFLKHQPVALDGREPVAGAAKEASVTIEFLDSSPFWIDHEPGDYLIIKHPDTGVQELVPLPTKETSLLVPVYAKDRAATLVRCLRPVEYYLAIFGIYVHHCFFVDLEKDFGEIPKIMQLILEVSTLSAEAADSLDSTISNLYQKVNPQRLSEHIARYRANPLIRIAENEQAQSQERGGFLGLGAKKPVAKTDRVDHCFRTLALLYVWLTGLYFRRAESNQQAIRYVAQLRGIWELLGNDIAFATGFQEGVHQMRTEIKDVPRKATQPQPSQIPSLSKLITKVLLS